MKTKETRQPHNQSAAQSQISMDFNATRAVTRRDAPETSKEAAASVNLPEKLQRVIYLFTKYGAMTDEELNDRALQEGFKITNTGMAPARCMLTPPNGKGIIDSGAKKRNRSGRRASVWMLG